MAMTIAMMLFVGLLPAEAIKLTSHNPIVPMDVRFIASHNQIVPLEVRFPPSGGAEIKVPSIAHDPCDFVLVYNTFYTTFNSSCFALNLCRIAYVSTGTTSGCSNTTLPVQNGVWMPVAGISTLIDGHYKTAFKLHINSTSLDGEGPEFQLVSGSVTGDPHVVNMDNQHFEIKAAGKHKLIQIPRATNSTAKLEIRIDATVTHMNNQKCNETYIRDLEMTGDWTKEFGKLQISSGSDMPKAPMLVNNQTPDVFFKGLPEWKVKLAPAVIQLTLGETKFHIAKHYRGKNGRQKGYLNLRVAGLNKFFDVGGILGHDDHSAAEQASPECMPSHAPAGNVAALARQDRSMLYTSGTGMVFG